MATKHRSAFLFLVKGLCDDCGHVITKGCDRKVVSHDTTEPAGGVRATGARIADVQERAVELYCAGWWAPAIAEELGVSVNGVYGLLRERGVVRSKSDAQRQANARARAKV